MLYENSRYLNTTLHTRGDLNNVVLKSRKRYSFNEDNCSVHVWSEGDTLDGLAYKTYGACALRWAILDANPTYRTEFDIQYGDKILLPDYDEVVSLVNV